jgi:hypothetical protein
MGLGVSVIAWTTVYWWRCHFIQPDSVPWCIYRGGLASAVVEHGVFVFRLGECCFRFLNSSRYVFRKLVGQLQGRPRLLGFKAHVRVSSSVDHEGGLLS